jgi:release factor glutamine methyltransferase
MADSGCVLFVDPSQSPRSQQRHRVTLRGVGGVKRAAVFLHDVSPGSSWHCDTVGDVAIGSVWQDDLVELLERAGFVAADKDAADLVACARGDRAHLDRLVQRRLTGEPIAWIVGATTFCDQRVIVEPGVYVPRWQTEPLVRRGVDRLPINGVAVDVCTGSGAVAAVLDQARPAARVVATELDDAAVACARANGVEVYHGDLFDPLPDDLRERVDVVVGVVPYVPTPALRLLQRDTFAFETALPYDGGLDGTDLLRRVATDARRFLRPGGALLLELGGDQADQIGEELSSLGYVALTILFDEDDDPRGIEATY